MIYCSKYENVIKTIGSLILRNNLMYCKQFEIERFKLSIFKKVNLCTVKIVHLKAISVHIITVIILTNIK